ncbi:MAG: succinate dehydrogenase iron-sulfur subunit [Archaeoglobaceae archaeon]|nr:succinate dehydrogenase iron-sulfur subunit [Archaeoglobaceae archaeon]
MMKLEIKRFNEKKGVYWQSFEVPARNATTVIDALFYIRENLDPSLAFRVSCRMGICGSCAMKINGRPRLACETQLLKFRKVKIEPLDNFIVLKDLITEFDGFFEKHKKVKPYLMAKVDYENPIERLQTPKQLKAYYNFTLCIKCGACNSVCPSSASLKNSLGPAALVSAYRFNADSRDDGKRERLGIISETSALWRCHSAMECSEVCPKKIEPAKAIQLLRRATLR